MQKVSCYGRQFGKWEPAPRHCSLIPGLPNEITLMVLARLPWALHGRLRYVCRAWRDALHPHASPLSSVRKALSISEEWVIFIFESGMIIFFDPLLQLCSKPLRLHKPRVGRFTDVFSTSGNQFLIHEMDVSGDSFRYFNTSTMLWHPKSHYFPMVLRRKYSSWMVLDNHLYVVGGESSNSREALSRVERYDIITRTWDSIPNMHEGRARAAVVQLQGYLCVIGGQNYGTQTKIYSGEVWDAEGQQWILEPQLWPHQVFDNTMPVVTTVMGTIYALQSARKEFLSYDPTMKLWTSWGAIPLANYPCSTCGDVQNAYCKQIFGVRNELWMVWNCSMRPTCRYRILSCVPTSQSSSLAWRVLPITMKFDKIYEYL